MNSNDSDKSYRVINEEMTSLINNKTWITIERPFVQNLIDYKWIFRHNEGLPSEPIRYKARLVADNYTKV